MGAKTDQMKGRLKKATGELFDDDDMKREGRADEAAGNAKERIDKTTERVRQSAERIVDRAKDAGNPRG